jgi:hypothetical protein
MEIVGFLTFGAAIWCWDCGIKIELCCFTFLIALIYPLPQFTADAL